MMLGLARSIENIARLSGYALEELDINDKTGTICIVLKQNKKPTKTIIELSDGVEEV